MSPKFHPASFLKTKEKLPDYQIIERLDKMPSEPLQISKRVLVADDDPVMRHLISTILKQQDHEVVVAEDGRAAYRILQSDSAFKAAILDMTMPFLEGLDLIRYMRTEKRLIRIPIMMITAQQDIKLMASSFAAGAAAFLPKPFTPEQLQSAIRMLLGNRQLIRIAA